MSQRTQALRLGKRRMATLRVLAVLDEPATYEKVRCRGVNLREWRTYNALGSDLRLLAEAGLVEITDPEISAGVHVKPRRFVITDAGRAVVQDQQQEARS